jgi:hypothetical protein
MRENLLKYTSKEGGSYGSRTTGEGKLEAQLPLELDKRRVSGSHKETSARKQNTNECGDVVKEEMEKEPENLTVVVVAEDQFFGLRSCCYYTSCQSTHIPESLPSGRGGLITGSNR